jgi:hypothetical protein
MLNREFRIRAVKTKKTNEDATPGEDKIIHPETVKLIAERSKEVVKYVALTAVGVYATIKTIDTLSQIALKKTKSADKED